MNKLMEHYLIYPVTIAWPGTRLSRFLGFGEWALTMWCNDHTLLFVFGIASLTLHLIQGGFEDIETASSRTDDHITVNGMVTTTLTMHAFTVAL